MTTDTPKADERETIAWLLWCATEGYLLHEDREGMRNWFLDDPANDGPEDNRDGWLEMADSVIAARPVPGPVLSDNRWDELIAEAGKKVSFVLDHALGDHIAETLRELADAIESERDRADAAVREMQARELHHFEAEEGEAAALAVIASVTDAMIAAMDGPTMTMDANTAIKGILQALTASSSTALQNRVREAAVVALEEAAEEIELPLPWDTHGNTGPDAITRNGEAVASSWLRARAATYRQGDGQ